MIESPIRAPLLTDMAKALTEPAGYHGTCWWDCESRHVDRAIPQPLAAFLNAVHQAVTNVKLNGERTGPAYLRVIDGGQPENHLLWHRDNADGGVRFTTAISSDNHPVNLAWPDGEDVVGRSTGDPSVRWLQPWNGRLLVFTTEPHGVPQMPVRLGERTVVFFTTLYRSRAEADLHTTNCGTPSEHESSEHATLPMLEAAR